MTAKKIFIKFLALSPPIVSLLFVLLIFQEILYLRGQSVLYTSYVHGSMMAFLVVFVTFLFYVLLNSRLPKIERKTDFKTFFITLIFVYLAVYVLLGGFIWGFLISTIASVRHGQPETFTHVFPAASLTIILIYRSMLYFEERSIPIRKELDGTLPTNFLKSIKCRGLIEDFIIAGVFVSGFVVFFSPGGLLPKGQSYLTSIGLDNLFLLGLLSIIFELWIWLMAVQFKKEYNLNNAGSFNELKIDSPTKRNQTLLKKLSQIPAIKRAYCHYKEHPKRYKFLFVFFVVFWLYYAFTHEPTYEVRDFPVQALFINFNITEKPIFSIDYLESKPLNTLNYSYIIIKKEYSNHTEILTKTDKDRFDSGLLRYTIVGYLNLQNRMTKTIVPYKVLVNVSNEKLSKEIEVNSENYESTLADGAILLFLNKNNLTKACVFFAKVMTNKLDPRWDTSKVYFFNNSNEVDVILYKESFHMVPDNQMIILTTRNNATASEFKKDMDLYPVYSGDTVNEAFETLKWNQTRAYTYCSLNIK